MMIDGGGDGGGVEGGSSGGVGGSPGLISVGPYVVARFLG